MNLYNVLTEYQELMRFLEENEGELTDELQELFKFNEETFKEKATNYIHMISRLECDIKYAKEEIDRINSYVNKKQTSVDMLKRNLLEALKIYGIKDDKSEIFRYETGTHKLSTRKSVVVEVDELTLDDKYKKYSFDKLTLDQKKVVLKALGKVDVKINESVSKTDLKKELESGAIIEGAELKNSFSIIIK